MSSRFTNRQKRAVGIIYAIAIGIVGAISGEVPFADRAALALPLSLSYADEVAGLFKVAEPLYDVALAIQDTASPYTRLGS